MRDRTEAWRWLVNFWTVALYGAVIFDFWKDNAAADLIGPLIAVYIAALTIFTGTKEFERWHKARKGRHPGEIFVVIWTLLIIFLLTADFLLAKPYKMPESVISAYVIVLGTLAVTQRSKIVHSRSKTKKPTR